MSYEVEFTKEELHQTKKAVEAVAYDLEASMSNFSGKIKEAFIDRIRDLEQVSKKLDSAKPIK